MNDGQTDVEAWISSYLHIQLIPNSTSGVPTYVEIQFLPEWKN